MRSRFEKDLSNLSTLAKEEETGFELPEDVKKFEQVLDWHLNQAAQRQGTEAENQKEIYDIQKEKQVIMARLKTWLSCIDNPECVLEKEDGSRDVSYDSETNKFIYNLDGKRAEATFGEIMTDIDWGIIYFPNKSSVPRNLLKQYFVERTKNDLRQLLDKQIIISEVEGNVAIPQRKEAYIGYRQAVESGVVEKQAGFISETIVKNILKKTSYDGGADFKIVEGDIFEDIEHKVDFIIQHISRNRGVEVTPEDRKDIGIQFTINMGSLGKKAYQVKGARKHITPEWHIDDLVLVAFPLRITMELLQKWKDAGRPAGGPDKFLNKQLAEKLFRTLIKDVVSSDRVDEYWDRVGDYFPEKTD